MKMKKILFGTLFTAFIIGAGTGAFAAGDNEKEKEPVNFGQMKPMMEQMHPDLSTEELKEMYESCHGNGAEDQAPEQQNVVNKL
jgi:hypothetical protein